MTKIMLNRPIKREAWGGGSHFITCFSEYLSKNGYDVVFSLEPNIDVIFMFDPRPSSGGDCANSIYQYKQSNTNTKIIQRINDTDVARPLDKPWRVDMLLQSNVIADHTIFISSWVKNHYIEKGFNPQKSNTVIINGCNSKWYFPDLNRDIDKKNVRLITHHWSDNFMKGFDIYNFLDEYTGKRDDISFTYLGRYNKDYRPKNTRLIDPTYGREVGDILRSHDIYVTAARYEACGMHHVEAASCGLPVLYHKDGGAIPEICRSHGVEFSTISGLNQALQEIIENYDDVRGRIDYKFLSSERCFKEYEDVIKRIID
jgi:glycosyltransferase involved in cell wall biosynthesis